MISLSPGLSTLERTDQVDGVPDTFLPLAGNLEVKKEIRLVAWSGLTGLTQLYLHAGFVGVEDEECCRCELQVIFLHEVLGGPRETNIKTITIIQPKPT